MHVQDALRAQYFFATLEKKFEEVRRLFTGDLSLFLRALCLQLDQVILPVIAHEISLAKDENRLKGNTPEERYQSFFIENHQFTPKAKSLPQKYPLVFSYLDQTLVDAFANLKSALNRLQSEKMLGEIQSISLISHSDKHQGQQTLLLQNKEGVKWIYKPRDLRPDQLLSRFISHLKLQPPYDLKTPDVFPRQSYGFIQFIERSPCQTEKELQDYYRRAGVLLAITDALNYTDGHSENLIACGPYPILLDGETLFQNYDSKSLKEKTVLSTQLIQKTSPDENKKAFHAAFQADQKSVYHLLYPHALNERSDSLKVELHGYREGIFHNLPHLNGVSFIAQDFISEVVEGFRIGYDAITKHASSILQDQEWWPILGSLDARALLRPTFNYVFLQRRIQQPDLATDQKNALAFMQHKLGDTATTSYEIRDLFLGNIPYFCHHPSKRHLYNGEGEKYENHFLETSLEQVKNNLKNRSSHEREAACSLVATHLTRAKHETSPAA